MCSRFHVAQSRWLQLLRLTAALLASLLAVLPGSAPAGQATPTEDEVKAAYVFNFARFIEWPPAKFAGNTSPLIIGLIGNGPVGDVIGAVIQKKTINNHPLVLRRLSPADDLTLCHILFVCRSERERFADIVSAVHGAAVLTVGESDQFLERGGIINFYVDSETVKFAVNLDSSDQARLKISSKLLAVAKIVKIKPG